MQANAKSLKQRQPTEAYGATITTKAYKEYVFVGSDGYSSHTLGTKERLCIIGIMRAAAAALELA